MSEEQQELSEKDREALAMNAELQEERLYLTYTMN
jgi:hypothetical protein